MFENRGRQLGAVGLLVVCGANDRRDAFMENYSVDGFDRNRFMF